MKKTISFLVLVLLFASCSHRSCPTYNDTNKIRNRSFVFYKNSVNCPAYEDYNDMYRMSQSHRK